MEWRETHASFVRLFASGSLWGNRRASQEPGLGGLIGVGELYERETTWFPSYAIGGQKNVDHLAYICEQLGELLLGGRVVEVSNENLGADDLTPFLGYEGLT